MIFRVANPSRGGAVLDFKKILKRVFVWALEVQARPCDLFVLVVYAAIIGFGIWNHEPWSDEAIPWVIVRENNFGGLLNFIFHNWDLHPILSYLLLFPLVKLGLPYAAQAVLNGLLSVGAAFLFITKAPFARIFRYLFLFSFYMLYEYSVIARPYMLAILLVFILATFYEKRDKRPYWYAILVMLLLHTDYMVFGLGAGLTVAFAVGHLGKKQRGMRFWIPLGIMAFNVLWVFWMGRSLPAGHHEYGQRISFNVQNIAQTITNAFSPFAGQVVYAKVISPLALWGGVVVFALVFTSVRKNIASLLILTISLGYLFIVFAFLHVGDYRHHGFILLTCVFVFWIGASQEFRGSGKSSKAHSRVRPLALTLIALFLALGVQNVYFVYLQEYFLPFSGAKEMAESIRGLQKGRDIFRQGYVIVAKHKRSSALMPYLPGIKFWNPCVGDYASYYINNRAIGACDDAPIADILNQTQVHFHGFDKVLLLLEQPLPIEEDSFYRYQKVYASGEKAFGYRQESFYLYRLQRKVPREVH